MLMRSFLCTALALLLSSSAPVSARLSIVRPAPVKTSLPRFESTPCKTQLARGIQVRCGYLRVPETRARASGKTSKTVRLYTTIFSSTQPNPSKRALVVLHGGPGGSSAPFVRWVGGGSGSSLLSSGDVVLFDQRGSGNSLPSTSCYLELSGLQPINTSSENVVEEVKATLACKVRLERTGIDLSSYTTIENAADVDDLRRALGYAQFDALGASYGSRLALEVARLYPQSLRSMTLTGVYAPGTSAINSVTSFDESLSTVFRLCSASLDCVSRYPDLERLLSRAYSQLNANPITLDLPEMGGPRRIDGELLLELIRNELYTRRGAEFLPALLLEIERNELEPNSLERLSRAASDVLGRDPSVGDGAHYSTMCSSDWPLWTPLPTNLRPEVSRSMATLNFDLYKNICAGWTGAAQVQNLKSVTSPIPALLVSGEFDPITPPRLARFAAQSLPLSQSVTVPASGHSAIFERGRCFADTVKAFLLESRAKVNTTCLSAAGALEFE